MGTTCPACESPVTLASPVLASEIVECGDCSSELEVAALDPVLLVLAPEPEEDWGE